MSSHAGLPLFVVFIAPAHDEKMSDDKRPAALPAFAHSPCSAAAASGSAKSEE